MSDDKRADADGRPPADVADRERCSVEAALTVVGEKWSLLVLREAFLGVRRFAEFRNYLQIPRSVLADRLAVLVEQGVLDRVPYRATGQRERHEYRLTAKGLDLYPVLVALMAWGDQHGAVKRRGGVRLTHRDCGAEVSLVLSCAGDHTLTDAREVTPRPGV